VDGVNSYFVSRAASQAVTVAVSGTGGDEVFAGYPWFAEMVQDELEREKQTVKTATRAILCKIAGSPLLCGLLGYSADALLPKGSGPGFIGRYGRIYQIFGIEGAVRALTAEIKHASSDRYSLEDDLSAIDELPGATPVERVTALCLRGYTSNQLLRDIDAVSMAHSLEVRVPFLDVPLVDLSLSLPSSSKIGKLDPRINPYEASYREMGSKKVLIDAGRKLGVLPEGIDRQPKRGFSMPFDLWLRGPLRDVLEETLSSEATRRRGVFEVNEVERLKKDFFEGKVGWSQPWLLMIIELWFRKVLDNRSVTREI
jgi:asparagine synthase (glutamine-hydrolysing)